MTLQPTTFRPLARKKRHFDRHALTFSFSEMCRSTASGRDREMSPAEWSPPPPRWLSRAARRAPPSHTAYTPELSVEAVEPVFLKQFFEDAKKNQDARPEAMLSRNILTVRCGASGRKRAELSAYSNHAQSRIH